LATGAVDADDLARLVTQAHATIDEWIGSARSSSEGRVWSIGGVRAEEPSPDGVVVGYPAGEDGRPRQQDPAVGVPGGAAWLTVLLDRLRAADPDAFDGPVVFRPVGLGTRWFPKLSARAEELDHRFGLDFQVQPPRSLTAGDGEQADAATPPTGTAPTSALARHRALAGLAGVASGTNALADVARREAVRLRRRMAAHAETSTVIHVAEAGRGGTTFRSVRVLVDEHGLRGLDPETGLPDRDYRWAGDGRWETVGRLRGGRGGKELEVARLMWPGDTSPGNARRIATSRDGFRLDADGRWGTLLEIVEPATLVLDDEEVGADPHSVARTTADAIRRASRRATLGDAFSDWAVDSYFRQMPIVPRRRYAMDAQHNYGLPVEDMYLFLKDLVDHQRRHHPRTPVARLALIDEGLDFGGLIATEFNGGLRPDLDLPSLATTLAGYLAHEYMRVGAMASKFYQVRNLSKNLLLWSTRETFHAALMALPEELRQYLVANAARIQRLFADHYRRHYGTKLDLNVRPGELRNLLDDRIAGRGFTVRDLLDNVLRPNPGRIIGVAEALGITTEFTAVDTNEGHLTHVALRVGEGRGFGHASPWFRAEVEQDEEWLRARVRRGYRRVVLERSVQKLASAVNLVEVESDLLRQLASLDGSAEGAGREATDLRRIWQGTLRLVVGLQDIPSRLSLSTVAPLLAQVPEGHRPVLAMGLLESVNLRLDPALRRQITMVDVRGAGLAGPVLLKIQRWFPKAWLRRTNDQLFPPLRWAQLSDRFRGANTAPERVSVRQVADRLADVAGGAHRITELARNLGVEADPPGDADAEQVLYDIAYVTVPTFGPTFTENDLVRMSQLLLVLGGDRRPYTWEQIEVSVGRLLGAPTPSVTLSFGDMAALAALIRPTDSPERNRAALRNHVTRAEMIFGGEFKAGDISRLSRAVPVLLAQGLLVGDLNAAEVSRARVAIDVVATFRTPMAPTEVKSRFLQMQRLGQAVFGAYLREPDLVGLARLFTALPQGLPLDQPSALQRAVAALLRRRLPMLGEIGPIHLRSLSRLLIQPWGDVAEEIDSLADDTIFVFGRRANAEDVFGVSRLTQVLRPVATERRPELVDLTTLWARANGLALPENYVDLEALTDVVRDADERDVDAYPELVDLITFARQALGRSARGGDLATLVALRAAPLGRRPMPPTATAGTVASVPRPGSPGSQDAADTRANLLVRSIAGGDTATIRMLSDRVYDAGPTSVERAAVALLDRVRAILDGRPGPHVMPSTLVIAIEPHKLDASRSFGALAQRRPEHQEELAALSRSLFVCPPGTSRRP
jgi:hypothetical protein